MEKKKLINFTQDDIIDVLTKHGIVFKGETSKKELIIKCPFHSKTEHDIIIDLNHEIHCEKKQIKHSWIHILQYIYKTSKGPCTFATALQMAAENLGKTLPKTNEHSEKTIRRTPNPYFKILTETTRLLNNSAHNIYTGDPTNNSILINSLKKLKISQEDIRKFELGYTNDNTYLSSFSNTSDFRSKTGTQKIATHFINIGLMQEIEKIGLNNKIIVAKKENISFKLLFPLHNQDDFVAGYYAIPHTALVSIETYPIERKYITHEIAGDIINMIVLKDNTIIPQIENDKRKFIPPLGYLGIKYINIYDKDKPKKDRSNQWEIKEKISFENKPYIVSIIKKSQETKYHVHGKEVFTMTGELVGYATKNNQILLPVNTNIRDYELFNTPSPRKKDIIPYYIYGEHYNKTTIAENNELILVLDPIHLIQLSNININNVLAINFPAAFRAQEEKSKSEEIIKKIAQILKYRYPEKTITLLIPTNYSYFFEITTILPRIFKNMNIVANNAIQINKQLATADTKTITAFINQYKQEFRMYYMKHLVANHQEYTRKPIISTAPKIYKQVKHLFSRAEFETIFCQTYKIKPEELEEAFKAIY